MPIVHKKEANSPKPYKLGLALSGGGARGFAHAGALLAIQEAGLKPDIVAGVSAGSVIAVLYSAGVHPLTMADLFYKTGFRDFAELSFGSGGLFRIEKFMNFILRALGGYTHLEDLPIPTYIGLTDLDKGKEAEFHQGPIGPIMMSSCSIPIVFKPVEIDGVYYVDGGVLRNHPAWMLRDKCETLIGINVSPLRQGGRYRSILDVALRSYNLMAKANQKVDMDLCDVSVATPELTNFAVFDLSKIKEVFISGYVHTRKALQEAGLWNPNKEE